MYTDGGSLPESDTGQRVELQIKKKWGSSRGGADRTGAEEQEHVCHQKAAGYIRLDRHHLSTGTFLQRWTSEVTKTNKESAYDASESRLLHLPFIAAEEMFN